LVRYVGIGKETTYGTAVAATRYLEAIASIKPDQKWIVPNPIAQRAFRKRNLGPYRAQGTIGAFPVEPENIGELLCGVLGQDSVTNPYAGVYLHTFSAADTLPSHTIRLGVEQIERILPGSLVESLKLNFAYNKDAEAQAEIYSGFLETKAAIGTPSISALQALNPALLSSTLNIGGASKKDIVYDAEITIKNHIPFDKATIDGRTFQKKRYGHREITGKLSMFFDDTAEYDRFIAGTSFGLTLTSFGPIIASTYCYFLDVELWNCVYEKDLAPDVKPQNEPLVVDAPFKAFYDVGQAKDIAVLLENTISAQY